MLEVVEGVVVLKLVVPGARRLVSRWYRQWLRSQATLRSSGLTPEPLSVPRRHRAALPNGGAGDGKANHDH